MKMTGNTMLITGGSAGIGRALAHRFHDLGNRVIVTGRRQDALDETAQGRPGIATRTLDMEDASAIAAFAPAIVADFPDLNVVVNNAGIMRFEDASAPRDLSDAEATIATNLLGPIRLIDALLPQLKDRGDGVIVTVSSGLGFVPMPKTPTYSATKAAIHSYTVALRVQLEGAVEVIELVPPGVQTDLTPGQATRDGYLPLGDFIDEVMALWSASPTPAEICVERVKPLRFAEARGTFDAALAMLPVR